MIRLTVPALDEYEFCDLASSWMVPVPNLGAHSAFPVTALLLFTELGET